MMQCEGVPLRQSKFAQACQHSNHCSALKPRPRASRARERFPDDRQDDDKCETGASEAERQADNYTAFLASSDDTLPNSCT